MMTRLPSTRSPAGVPPANVVGSARATESSHRWRARSALAAPASESGSHGSISVSGLLDSTVLDAGPDDPTVLDSTVLDAGPDDPTVLDSTVPISTVLDSTVLDSTVPNSTVP